ncbi:MAG: DnaJ domain-containing protein [Anaerolineales bacterium]
MDFKDNYEILGVALNADKKDIQQTFRQLVRKVHPDVNPAKRGDLFTRVRLVLPETLSDQEVNSIGALTSARQKLS